MKSRFLSNLISLFTKKRWILLESESDMCDSTKTIFDKMILLGLNKKYRIFWCVENIREARNNNAYKNVLFLNIKKNGLREKVIYALSHYAIYTHRMVGNQYNKKQIRVFVTHAAMPIKNSSGWFGNPRLHTFILGTSKECVGFRKKVMGESNNYIITGLPRNDDLFSCQKSDVVPITKGMNYIIWMPTFKHHRESTRNDYGVQTQSDISFLTESNMLEINKKMKEVGMLLIIKPHPSQDLSYLSQISLTNIVTITNQMLLKLNINPYSLLGNSEALITDFSSVYLDYLLLDKPIAFELNDQEKYKNGIGYVMDNPDEYMVGYKIFSLDDFLKFIVDIKNNNDFYKKERTILKNRIHSYQDNNSTERVLKMLKII